jgi:serine/threonine-protein kinase
MPLSPADISALSRLLDEMLGVPMPQRAAWLAALPGEHEHLRPHLEHALSEGGDAPADVPLDALPRLPGFDDEGGEAMPGERVGPYRLLSEIGRGGMGSVWLAERADGMYAREVALKLPRLSRSPRLAERMARERQIGALLEHPHIARLYDAGIDESGRPYLVMERVVGTGLREHCAQRHLGIEQRLALMLQVCAAVAHAHRHLVIHRDIKPSNLLVNTEGDVKLLDFGIAKLLDADAPEGATASDGAQHTHTPGYAAPEQLRGGPVSTSTDLYSLGVVLHELLADALPDTSPADGAEPSALLPADLRAVLSKTLRTAPGERYTSVERLADELRRVLSSYPVLARPAGVARRLQLFARRHRFAVRVSVLVLGLLLAGGIVVFRQHAREMNQAQRADRVREFLFDLVEDVEPLANQPQGETQGVAMVEAAVSRAGLKFAGQPVLQGQVLTELGLMLRRLHRPDEALKILREADTLLEAAAAADDPTLQIGRAQLAVQLLSADAPGSAAQAGSLANRALAACGDRSVRCAKARAYSHDVLSALAGRQGDSAAALMHARQAVVDNQLAFGARHAELALSLSNLAVTARNQGMLPEAADAMARAQAIAQGAPLRAEDARSLRLNYALVMGDSGQFDAARAALGALLAEPAAQSDRALQQRLLAQALVAQGLLADAARAADSALAAARSVNDDWEATLALQARARAASGLARHADARRDIAATLDGLRRQQLAEGGVEILRAKRFAAEIALRAGADDEARAQLEPLLLAHRPTPTGPVLAPVDLALVLDLLGTLARRRGDAGAARDFHAQAGALLATSVPATHLLRARNSLLAALAAPPDAMSLAELQRASARYEELLPVGSTWRQDPKSWTAGPDVRTKLIL